MVIVLETLFFSIFGLNAKKYLLCWFHLILYLKKTVFPLGFIKILNFLQIKTSTSILKYKKNNKNILWINKIKEHII